MCFHEISADAVRRYVAKLARVADQFLVINAFSENRSMQPLPSKVVGVQKLTYSTDDVKRLFPGFDLVRSKDYEAIMKPDPPHTDGAIAAKRAYVLFKRWDAGQSEAARQLTGGKATASAECAAHDPSPDQKSRSGQVPDGHSSHTNRPLS